MLKSVQLLRLLLVIEVQDCFTNTQLSDGCNFNPTKFSELLFHTPVVISGTALQVTADPGNDNLQTATVRVKRIFKGFDIINNKKKIHIYGLGNVQICHNVLYERDTKIILLNELNGLFYLNSSLIPINLDVLDHLNAFLKGRAYKKRRHIKRIKCEEVKCPYGAKCRPHSGECECRSSCNTAGPTVCGTDNVSYLSECHLSVRSCLAQTAGSPGVRVKRIGACEKRNPCEDLRCGPGEQCVISEDGQGYISAHCVCPQQCDNYGDSVESSPVCSNSGTDFPSLCHLRVHACKTKHNESVKYYGKCDPCKDYICSAGTICKVSADRRAECRCSQQCTMHSDPVCATDGNTYENECLMSVSACRQDIDIQVYNKGRCKADNPCKKMHCSEEETCHIQENGTAICRCVEYCPPVMKPVCAINGKTYENECEMRRSACQSKIHNAVRHAGTCGLGVCAGYDGCRPPKVCVDRGGHPVCECEACDSQLSEVCASDGITYANECKMRLESCLSGKFIYQKYSGVCDGCVNVRCEFYAVCVSDEAGTGSCRCPNQCADVDDSGTVCATDGTTYRSECYMRLAACQQQQFIVVAFRGSCDSCSNVICPDGQQCEDGVCACPTNCPDAIENSAVCGSDGTLYPSECHLKIASCRKGSAVTTQHLSNCQQPSLRIGEFSAMSGCDQQSCSFGGICVKLSDSDPSDVCLCEFNCSLSSDAEAICASDGNAYNSTCLMDLASCQQQKPIYQLMPIHICHFNDECGCNRVGSYGNVCDEHGRCRCLPGVEGKKCDHCMAGFWGLHLIAKGALGCQPCGCSVFGSSRLDCEQSSGRCQCRPDSYGVKCDVCGPDFIMTSSGCVKKAEFHASKDCSTMRCHHGAKCVIGSSGVPDCECPEDCSMAHLGLVAEMTVCGSDGSTYDNICELRQFACTHQLDLVPSTLGSCSQENSDEDVQRRRGRKLNSTPTLGNLCVDDTDCRIFNAQCGELNVLRLRTCECRQGFFPSRDMTLCIQEKNGGKNSSWLLDGASGMQISAQKLMNRPFSVRMQAQPRNASGVLFYGEHGHLNRTDDFALLLLTDFKLIFSFSLSGEIFAIEWKQELAANRTYTIRVSHLDGHISLAVDDFTAVVFSLPSAITGLPFKFTAPVHIGYAPVKLLRFHSMRNTLANFTGCLSNVVINGRKISQTHIVFLGSIVPCLQGGCEKSTCLNGGSCLLDETGTLPMCKCTEEFTGQFCERQICGNSQTCVENSFSIKGELTTTGKSDVKTKHPMPLFVGKGFLTKDNLELDVKKNLKVELWLKTLDSDGLIFYWAKMGTSSGQYVNGDFVALVLIASQPHFFWNLGSGIAYIRSTALISNDRFHSIRFGRHLRNGFIQVDSNLTAFQTSQPGNTHLDVSGATAFVGGVPNKTVLPDAVPELAIPFKGVIQRLVINGHVFLELLREFRQIGRVEAVDDVPRSSTKCGNGRCIAKLNKYSYKCPLGYKGPDCIQQVKLKVNDSADSSMQFDGRNEYPFMKKHVSKKRLKLTTDYRFVLKTNKSEGLLWWESRGHTVHSDYLAIFVLAGRLGFAINLGTNSKVKTIGSNTIVSDDRWHSVSFIREKRKSLLTVDNEKVVYISPPGATELNTDGIIWIGGKKKLPRSFPVRTLYKGCLRDVHISSQLINIRREFPSKRTPSKCRN